MKKEGRKKEKKNFSALVHLSPRRDVRSGH